MNGRESGFRGGVCGVLVALAGSVCTAQTTVDWAAAANGNWSDPLAWSPNTVPNNTGPTFIARILLPGVYTATLDIDVTISGFQLNAAGATFALDPGRTLTTNGNNVFNAALITGGAGSQIISNGMTLLSGGGTYTNTVFSLGGSGTVDGVDDWDICDTCVDLLTGSMTDWMGTGGFNLDNSATQSELINNGQLTVSGSGSRSITSTSAVNKFVNNGTLIIDFDAEADTLSILGATMDTGVGSKVQIKTGKLVTDTLGPLSGGRLAGGSSWRIEDGGELDLGTQQVTELDTTVELLGPNSLFAALDGVETIGVDGVLSIDLARDFTTDPGVLFDVQGEVSVGADSAFTVSAPAGGFANLQGTALRGGRFVVAGRFLVDSAGIDTIGADVVLDGMGRFEGQSGGQNLLAGLSLIETAGTFTVQNGANFTTAGDLALEGALRVGAGTTLDVSGQLGAFDAGVLRTGDIEVRGTLIADNTRVERVESRLVVGRDGQFLFRDSAGTLSDGLTALTTVASGGTFGLVEGRALDLTATNNTVTVEGTLLLGASGLEGPMNTGSRLSAGAYVQAVGGTLTIGINGIDDFGNIVVDTLTFGAGGSADTAGTLEFMLSDAYAAAFGDEFLIFDLPTIGGLFGAGFASITVDGTLGAGLFFEQFSSADGFGVRVVPAPAAAAVLAGGLLAGRRRR